MESTRNTGGGLTAVQGMFVATLTTWTRRSTGGGTGGRRSPVYVWRNGLSLNVGPLLK